MLSETELKHIAKLPEYLNELWEKFQERIDTKGLYGDISHLPSDVSYHLRMNQLHLEATYSLLLEISTVILLDGVFRKKAAITFVKHNIAICEYIFMNITRVMEGHYKKEELFDKLPFIQEYLSSKVYIIYQVIEKHLNEPPEVTKPTLTLVK